MGKKSSKAEIDRRIHEVVKLLTSAKTNSYIYRHAAEEWGVNSRSADTYIARAREIIRADYDVERSDFMASRLALLDKIAEESIACKQHSNAIGALKLQTQITRLLDGHP